MKPIAIQRGLLLLLGSAVLSGGCGLNRLSRNAWVGFGESVGSLSANILVDYIRSTFTSDVINPPPPESE